VNPVGLYDLNRDPRPVAEAYRYLVSMFRNDPFPALPTAEAIS
jgi:hypothetical protein